MGARIDHLMFAVTDLRRAANWLFDTFGLEAQPGGHQGNAGTGNWYVPLGRDQFIEVIAVTNPESRHPVVKTLQKHLASGDRLYSFGIEVDDIEATARRVGEPVYDNETNHDDGRTISFKLTGVSGLIGRGPLMPHFLQTIDGRQWRGAFRQSQHKVATDGIARVEYGGDPKAIAAWIDDPSLPIKVTEGKEGLLAAYLRLDGREVELRI